jgi:hypothetical protein
MKRIDVYVTEEQFYFIGTIRGTLSEHVRRALDDYIAKVKVNSISSSASKGVEKNG